MCLGCGSGKEPLGTLAGSAWAASPVGRAAGESLSPCPVGEQVRGTGDLRPQGDVRGRPSPRTAPDAAPDPTSALGNH